MIVRALRRPDEVCGTIKQVWEGGESDMLGSHNPKIHIDNADRTFNYLHIYISMHVFNHQTISPSQMFKSLLRFCRAKRAGGTKDIYVLLPEKALDQPPFNNLHDRHHRNGTLFRFYFQGSPIMKYDRTYMGSPCELSISSPTLSNPTTNRAVSSIIQLPNMGTDVILERGESPTIDSRIDGLFRDNNWKDELKEKYWTKMNESKKLWLQSVSRSISEEVK